MSIYVALLAGCVLTMILGKFVLAELRKLKAGQEIRQDGPTWHNSKAGTPTMGGVIILLAILVPILLLGRLDNIYIQLMIVSTVWLGLLGFLDDYIKVFRHNKEGLKGKFKIVGQVGIGINVGTVM